MSGNISLLDALNKSFRRRKYYLNSKVKQFAKVRSLKKEISIVDKKLDGLQKKERYYLQELANKYGYVIQSEIPN